MNSPKWMNDVMQWLARRRACLAEAHVEYDAMARRSA
jgi:hypothetical protein